MPKHGREKVTWLAGPLECPRYLQTCRTFALPCAFYLFIRQPMGRKSALRREIPWILRGFQGRLSC